MERAYNRVTTTPIVSGYQSPIEMFVKEITNKVNEENDKYVLQAVAEVGITVNKDELVRALHYDRDQYIAGYKAGFEAGKTAGVMEFQAWMKD